MNTSGEDLRKGTNKYLAFLALDHDLPVHGTKTAIRP